MAKVRVDSTGVEARIKHTYDRYEREAYLIFRFYAVEIVKYMMMVQGSAPAETKGAFWTNHTFKAVKAFIANAWQVPSKTMGLTMEYRRTPFYTENLERDFGGRFAALPRLLATFEPLIIADLQKLYGEV